MSSCASTKSLMSSLSSLSHTSEAIYRRLDSLSATVYFLSKTCYISKSKRHIQVIYLVSKEPSRSNTALLNWATRTWASISSRKCMPYSQNQNFFKALRTPWHSCFMALYPFSVGFQWPLSYQARYLFLFSSSCISTLLYPSKLASAARIIKPTSLLYMIQTNARAVVKAVLRVSMVF